ncbi:hypothetical protein BJY52DRAFT_1418670 [Lactarius psammicola]|nr:hypothetical protein BJY52DRAFT_1418670 [Lactarius psammicola]
MSTTIHAAPPGPAHLPIYGHLSLQFTLCPRLRRREVPISEFSQRRRHLHPRLSIIAVDLGSNFGFELENVRHEIRQTCDLRRGSRRVPSLGRGTGPPSNRGASSSSLFVQQAITLFAFKSGTGFHTFNCLANLASEFIAQGLVGAASFDLDTVNIKHCSFVDVVILRPVTTTGPLCIPRAHPQLLYRSTTIFFVAFAQMLYYLIVMKWIIKNFAWFFETMNVSGSEAVVAAASPFLGQGESACLVPVQQLDSALELLHTLQAQHVAAQNMISFLKAKVNALESLVHAS